MSQFWITINIWTNCNERLASTEKLFVTPMYSSILIDQSLALNRRIINNLELEEEKDDDEEEPEDEKATYIPECDMKGVSEDNLDQQLLRLIRVE